MTPAVPNDRRMLRKGKGELQTVTPRDQTMAQETARIALTGLRVRIARIAPPGEIAVNVPIDPTVASVQNVRIVRNARSARSVKTRHADIDPRNRGLLDRQGRRRIVRSSRTINRPSRVRPEPRQTNGGMGKVFQTVNPATGDRAVRGIIDGIARRDLKGRAAAVAPKDRLLLALRKVEAF